MLTQKSRPARSSLLNALASVLMTVATSLMSWSSNAAPIRMGCGKEVAYRKGPESEKFTPGLSATPCNASCHQVYAGNPSLGTPGDVLPVLLSFSSTVNALINAFARVRGSERDVRQETHSWKWSSSYLLMYHRQCCFSMAHFGSLESLFPPIELLCGQLVPVATSRGKSPCWRIENGSRGGKGKISNAHSHIPLGQCDVGLCIPDLATLRAGQTVLKWVKMAYVCLNRRR